MAHLLRPQGSRLRFKKGTGTNKSLLKMFSATRSRRKRRLVEPLTLVDLQQYTYGLVLKNNLLTPLQNWRPLLKLPALMGGLQESFLINTSDRKGVALFGRIVNLQLIRQVRNQPAHSPRTFSKSNTVPRIWKSGQPCEFLSPTITNRCAKACV